MAEVEPDKSTSSITVLDYNDDILASYGTFYNGVVTVEQMPPFIVQALIATEDRRFYKHHGIDPFGIVRAAITNTFKGHIAEGGSTITQQLAKNLFLTHDKTYKRKIKEVAYALWLDYHLTKEQILNLYLNRVYFGAGAYGISAASERYYNKPVQQLTLSEAAVLVGLLKAPSRLNPIKSPNAARARGRVVLDNMKADDKETVFFNAGGGKEIWYFRDWVALQVKSILGDIPANVEVHTTLNPTYQYQAAEALQKYVKVNALDKNISQGAVIRLEEDGRITAMVGGVNYNYSQYNRATQARRQAGSTFKVFVALAALKQGYGLDAVLADRPFEAKGWKPENSDGKFRGDVSLRRAFVASLNVPIVRLAQDIGIKQVIKAARSMGITTPLRNDLSTALGSVEVTLSELTSAYATIANGGRVIQPWAIQRITQGDKILYERQGEGGQIISNQHLPALRSLLHGVVNYPAGTGKQAQIKGQTVYGKTGTSQDFRDAWFIGFSEKGIAGVWLGNDDNSAMNKVTGGNSAAKVWHDVMR